jgi:hypothetical protein
MDVITTSGNCSGSSYRIRDSYNSNGNHLVRIRINGKKVCEYVCDRKQRMYFFKTSPDANHQLLSHLIRYSIGLRGDKKLKFTGYCFRWLNFKWISDLSTRHLPQELAEVINQQAGNTIKLINSKYTSYKGLKGHIPSIGVLELG